MNFIIINFILKGTTKAIAISSPLKSSPLTSRIQYTTDSRIQHTTDSRIHQVNETKKLQKKLYLNKLTKTIKLKKLK